MTSSVGPRLLDQPPPASPADESPDVSCPANEPSWLWTGTIPSLNGLRAVSILIVILSHMLTQAGISNAYLPVAGETGVDVFFVISGFLITLLLLREERRTGSISVVSFYLRRALRIAPAYFVFLGVVASLAAYGIFQASTKDLLAAATYTTNLVPWGTWDVGHTWSLCVEEHFYLLWPLTLVCCGRRCASRLAAGYVLLTPFLRAILRLAFRERIHLWAFTPTRMDAIAVGCCLAFAATSPRLRSKISLTLRQAGGLLLASIGFLVATHAFLQAYALRIKIVGYYAAFLSGTVNAVVIAVIVWICVSFPDRLAGKLLNLGPVVFLGTLSYSLYLWQQPFFHPQRSSWFCQFPANILLCVVVSLGSYYLVERPFLSLKLKWIRNR